MACWKHALVEKCKFMILKQLQSTLQLKNPLVA